MDAVRVIAEPRRQQLLRLCWQQEGTAGELAGAFDITFGAVSQHLKVLREAGLVTERRDGTRHLFSANHDALRQLRDQLSWMWDEGLADLKAAAEHETKAKKRRDR